MQRWVRLAAGLLVLGLSTPTTATKVPAPGDDTPLEEARRWFTEDPDAPMIVPKNYDVTIVEYMDYQCPACRASQQAVSELLASDKKVRMIFRDLPIFGAASERAARLAIASKYQGKYVAFHKLLLATPRPLNDEKIEAAAKKAGVDWTRLQRDLKENSTDIEDLLARNAEQADMIGLEGTPGFIIGDTQSFGAVKLEDLQHDVQKARAQAKGRSGAPGAKR